MSDEVLLKPGARVYVAGHRGLVGGAVYERLAAAGFEVVGRPSSELDLRDRAAAMDYVGEVRPAAIVVAAARVGGIVANDTYPVDFLQDNLSIQVNLFDAAHRFDVGRLLFLGSSCIYPRDASQPISESSLLTGPLESTNEAYAVAKIAGIKQVQAFRKQYGRHWISAMPTNLYGANDNFDLATSHVLPALIRKFHEAATSGAGSVTLWGSGTPRREFLHVDDLAEALLLLLRSYDEPDIVNVGTGKDIAIRELAELVADVVGFEGTIELDRSKPDGTPRKLLDVSRLTALGWAPAVSLRAGIESVYRAYASTSTFVGHNRA